MHDTLPSARTLPEGEQAFLRHGSLWQIQAQIWGAIMLRDMRSRFFGNALGYLVIVGWPVTHMAVVIAIHQFQGTAAIYGNSLMAYLVCGFLPLFAVVYMSRMTVYSVAYNIPLLSFPAIKPMDLLIGHTLLEVVNACLMALFFFGVLSLFGYDMEPHHLIDAFIAFGAAILLGIGLGVLNGVIALLARGWITGYALVIILMYLTSGALVDVDRMPEQVRQIFQINPVYECVSWMHAAFLDIHGPPDFGHGYILACGLGSLAIGLALERFVRGRIR